ncbi:MAG: hypothetical protein ACRCZF_18930, partial [Gemmataceae bacterium]
MRTFLILALGGALFLVQSPAVLAFGKGGAARGGAATGPNGSVAGKSKTQVSNSPFDGVNGNKSQKRSAEGPRGTTVQTGKIGGIQGGTDGGIKGGRASGTKVTTPGGETFTKGSAGGVNKSADGSVKAGAAAGAAVKGPEGTSAIGRRGGVAIDSTGAIT